MLLAVKNHFFICCRNIDILLFFEMIPNFGDHLIM